MVVEVIEYREFEKVEMRVGRITAVDDFPEARKPAYKVTVDFGEEFGIRRSSAQITGRYSSALLVGRLVVAVTNFAPKKIAGFKSEVLLLGATADNGDVILLTLNEDVPLGARVF